MSLETSYTKMRFFRFQLPLFTSFVCGEWPLDLPFLDAVHTQELNIAAKVAEHWLSPTLTHPERPDGEKTAFCNVHGTEELEQQFKTLSQTSWEDVNREELFFLHVKKGKMWAESAKCGDRLLCSEIAKILSELIESPESPVMEKLKDLILQLPTDTELQQLEGLLWERSERDRKYREEMLETVGTGVAKPDAYEKTIRLLADWLKQWASKASVPSAELRKSLTTLSASPYGTVQSLKTELFEFGQNPNRAWEDPWRLAAIRNLRQSFRLQRGFTRTLDADVLSPGYEFKVRPSLV